MIAYYSIEYKRVTKTDNLVPDRPIGLSVKPTFAFLLLFQFLAEISRPLAILCYFLKGKRPI